MSDATGTLAYRPPPDESGAATASARARGPAWDRSEWRTVLPGILAIFLVTRLLIAAVAISVETLVPLDTVPPSYDARPVVASLTGFDSVYYLGIAAEGYHMEPVREEFRDWVFFPAYPLVVKAASLATFGDIALAAILVSNAAFLGALFVLYRLSREYLDADTSARALVFLAIGPGAAAFAMAYSESLFLLVAAGAFLAAERRRWVVMALLVAAATLTRLPGIALVIPLAILLWRQAGTPRRTLLWLAAAPAALVAFSVYQSAVLGDPVAFLTGQAAWNFPSRGEGGVPGVGSAPVFDPSPLLLTGVLVVYLFLFVYMRADRVPLPYVVWSALTVVMALGSLRLLSIERYLAVAWPFSWVLANRRSTWFRALWPAISGGLFVVFAVLHFSGALAP